MAGIIQSFASHIKWCYDTNINDGAAYVSYRFPPAGKLLSGTCWRLNEDVRAGYPSLEIPNVECAPPPYPRDQIKYPVGEPVIKAINLLDWKSTDDCSMDGELPLIWTEGLTTEGSTALLLAALNGNEDLVRRILEPMAALPAKVGRGMMARGRAEKRTKDMALPLLGGTLSRD